MFGWIKRLRDGYLEGKRLYYKSLVDSLKPCPICGHKAALIHWCGENNPEFWTVECGDFDDSNYFCPMPIRCNFYTCLDIHYEVKEHLTIEDAVRYWNDVIVPIGIAAKEAFDRMQEYDKIEGDKSA